MIKLIINVQATIAVKHRRFRLLPHWNIILLNISMCFRLAFCCILRKAVATAPIFCFYVYCYSEFREHHCLMLVSFSLLWMSVLMFAPLLVVVYVVVSVCQDVHSYLFVFTSVCMNVFICRCLHMLASIKIILTNNNCTLRMEQNDIIIWKISVNKKNKAKWEKFNTLTQIWTHTHKM